MQQLIAVGYEGFGKYLDAAKLLEGAAESAPSEDERLELRANAARDYQLAGDKSNALRIWRALAALSGKAIADEARVRIGEIEVVPVR